MGVGCRNGYIEDDNEEYFVQGFKNNPQESTRIDSSNELKNYCLDTTVMLIIQSMLLLEVLTIKM